ncbi:MAG TPA: Ig-like domain-containing protein, partial [Macromonas sp.]|nr:Ig-like domain-containing protein [Macromonas sp.]
MSLSAQAQQMAQAVDNVAPTVKSFSPTDGSSTALPTANVTVKFSEAIQRGSGLIVLKNAVTGAVVETFDAASSNRLTINNDTLTINPTKDLAFNTKYQVTFASGTVKDLTGNRYAGSSSYDFKTRTDNVAPTVKTFTPTDGSSTALPTANVTVKFSEAIQRGSGLIVLKNAVTGAVVETFDAASSNRLTINNDTLTINPTKDLAFNTKYQVTFASGTVKDLTGNRYAGSSSYDFKTRTDNVAPTVKTFSPTDGSSTA